MILNKFEMVRCLGSRRGITSVASNYVSKKPTGESTPLIINSPESEYPLFLTLLQLKELGGYIKKGIDQ